MNGGFALEEWQIRLVLPHRPPLLQLDRVTLLSPSLDRLEATKVLAGADTMIQRGGVAALGGAFPRLAPGAVIEALAQCCGLLLRLHWLANDGADLAAFSAGDSSQVQHRDIPRSVLAESEAHFAAPAAPGRVLRLATHLVLSRGDMHRFDSSAHAAADSGSPVEIASARITLSFPRLITAPVSKVA